MNTERLLNLRSLLSLGIFLVSICIDLSIANSTEFQHPTKYRNYTGFFNEERCLKGTKYQHQGLDIVGYEGENIRGGEVRPYAEGTVKKADWSDKIGWYVIIDHGGGLKTKYAHLLRKPPVEEGDRVNLNDKIGEIDNTGEWSTGDHLHFQVELNGQPVDPFEFLPRSEYICRSVLTTRS
jgi:murein DD-endopeptidase MepM/ murein hydrolase activator NlpD